MPSVSTHLKTGLLVSVIFIPSLVKNIRGRIWEDLFLILFNDVGIVTYKLRCGKYRKIELRFVAGVRFFLLQSIEEWLLCPPSLLSGGGVPPPTQW